MPIDILSDNDAVDEISRDYYATTANRGHQPTAQYYADNASALIRRLGPWLPESDRASCIDLACGCGELLYTLESLGYPNVVGVDMCEEELQHARQFVKAGLNNSDALEYLKARASDSCDFISALNFLEHLSRRKLVELLKECRRVLKPGGTLVAMVPNAVSPFGSLTRYWDITHQWAFTTNNFRQLAAACGFSAEVEFRECGPVAHGPVSAIRYVLWQIVRGAIAIRFLIELGMTKDRIYTMDMLVRMRK